MKLNLTYNQIKMILEKDELHGDETKFATAKKLISLGIYEDTGDKYPFFWKKNKGNQITESLRYLIIENLIITKKGGK